MAVTVSSRGTTKVKKVTVGKPIRKINPAVATVNNIAGISTEGAETGSVLVYNENTNTWEAQKTLENTNVNGGQY
jgi:hypothetical protein